MSHFYLYSTTPDINTIGIGRFGSCTEMIYQDVFMVFVKKMEKDKVSLQGVKSEAAILCALNTGGFTPPCFGVCLFFFLLFFFLYIFM